MLLLTPVLLLFGHVKMFAVKKSYGKSDSGTFTHYSKMVTTTTVLAMYLHQIHDLNELFLQFFYVYVYNLSVNLTRHKQTVQTTIQ